MDLNELFSRHQIALINAATADEGCARQRHTAEADNVASRIRDLQRRLGACAVPLMSALSFPVAAR